MQKFNQWLNERNFLKSMLGLQNPQEEIPTLTVAPAKPKEPDLSTALQISFGKNTPYMVDKGMLEDLARTVKMQGNINKALEEISANKGFPTRVAIQQFLTYPGTNLDKIHHAQIHRRATAQRFAAGD